MPAKDLPSRIKLALRDYLQLTDPMERLAMSRRIREAAEEMEAEAIEQARKSGATWRSIGACYGLTKQGAQQRFRTDRTLEPPAKNKKSDRAAPDAR